jgi:hypothetical protein
MSIDNPSVQPMDAGRPKPKFVTLLAWTGVLGNVVYLIFTSSKLILQYPRQWHESSISILITMIFLYIYIRMINNYSLRTYVISTLLAFLWFGFLLFKYILIPIPNDAIESYFLFGSILAIVVNLIALYQIWQCLTRPIPSQRRPAGARRNLPAWNLGPVACHPDEWDRPIHRPIGDADPRTALKIEIAGLDVTRKAP